MFPYIIIMIASSPFTVEQLNNNCFLFGPRVVALGLTFWSHFVLLLSGALDHHHQDTSAPIKDNKKNRRFGLGALDKGEESEEKGPFGEGRQEEEEQKRLDAL